MGVYVKGMKMPITCEGCPCWWVDGEGFIPSCCQAGSEYEKEPRDHNKQDTLPDDCPLVEVPEPHGDLIDRDILEQELRNGIKAGNLEEGYEHYANINSMDDCVECVRYADTVIEAEGE